jgi:hypothetical protein
MIAFALQSQLSLVYIHLHKESLKKSWTAFRSFSSFQLAGGYISDFLHYLYVVGKKILSHIDLGDRHLFPDNLLR